MGKGGDMMKDSSLLNPNCKRANDVRLVIDGELWQGIRNFDNVVIAKAYARRYRVQKKNGKRPLRRWNDEM